MRSIARAVALIVLPALAPAAGAAQDAAAAMTTLNTVLPAAAEEQLALSAAPEHLRGAATVYVFGTRGFTRVREGTNGITCLVNRDGFLYGSAQFKPTCWDAVGAATYVPVMLKVGELLAAGTSAREIGAAIDAGFAAGTFRAPRTGGIAYMLAGDVDVDRTTGAVTRQAFAGHYMFYAVGATSAQLGYSADAARRDPSLPFVFTAGAGGSHGLAYIISVPGDLHRHAAAPAGRRP